MSEIILFNFKDTSVRALTIDGAPWFVAADVATGLGYSNPRDAISKHVDDEDKGVAKHDTLGGRQNVTTINESGVYALIFGSKLEGAKAFKRWVTSEVLPQLRRTGMVVDEKRITEEQIQAGRELLDSIAQKRLEEKQDYRSILHALKLGGAVSEEYRLVQNTLYLSLFGKTAYQIRTTQPQRTGTPRKRGNGFRKSSIAKDFLTEQQLAVLNSTVLATIAQIQLRHPDGATAAQMLDAIHRAISIIRIGGAA